LVRLGEQNERVIHSSEMQIIKTWSTIHVGHMAQATATTIPTRLLVLVSHKAMEMTGANAQATNKQNESR